MFKNIGNYYLTQDIKTANGLKEFSDEEYLASEQVGMSRTLEDEKMFNGFVTNFASVPWESTMIGSTKGKIYKIALQIMCTDKQKAKQVLNSTAGFINIEIGKYNEHSFFSNRYIWDTSEGNIILNRMSRYNIHAVNLIFTSNIIREQISQLQGSV